MNQDELEQSENIKGKQLQSLKDYLLPPALFLLTLFTTTISGIEWASGQFSTVEFSDLTKGLPYSLSILFVLGCHEFGHYFASMYHKVKTTLPYFIPLPSITGLLNFGTLGAVIKTKTVIPTKRALFDIGVYGPIAGFIACLGILIYGFTHLPTVDYILNIHPDYFEPNYGKQALGLSFGDTLLFSMLRELLTNRGDFVPPMSEIYHYPFLCVGWFGLFVTSMNLIPVGQLDGGHIIYAMFGGENQVKISSVAMAILILLGLGGIVEGVLGTGTSYGWGGWIFWAAILYFVIKVKHPPIYDSIELDFKRKVIGYFAILIFILCFSPSPFVLSL